MPKRASKPRRRRSSSPHERLLDRLNHRTTTLEALCTAARIDAEHDLPGALKELEYKLVFYCSHRESEARARGYEAALREFGKAP
jgi:hypothetical protein